MQQYFTDRILKVSDTVDLDSETLHHLVRVLRKDSDYVFRLADGKGKIFHCHLIDDKRCLVDGYLDENNELDHDITCIISLIKNDRFEMCVQKLVELGIKRIVPYQAARSVVKVKDDKKLVRLRKIVREAAEQSHRNIIPDVCEAASLKDLEKYLSDSNYICYESYRQMKDIDITGSVTYIIGPEGGFEESEYQKICAMGYEPVSLGKRILRAETAAIYMSSVLVSKCQ